MPCEKLVIFAHQNNGLAKNKCAVIVNFIRAVGKSRSVLPRLIVGFIDPAA